jgi:hypothetical protein
MVRVRPYRAALSIGATGRNIVSPASPILSPHPAALFSRHPDENGFCKSTSGRTIFRASTWHPDHGCQRRSLRQIK